MFVVIRKIICFSFDPGHAYKTRSLTTVSRLHQLICFHPFTPHHKPLSKSFPTGNGQFSISDFVIVFKSYYGFTHEKLRNEIIRFLPYGKFYSVTSNLKDFFPLELLSSLYFYRRSIPGRNIYV